ncbi:hypothetical protein [Caldovatus aquaticus]|uniref:SPOR domain-containing protein n=1 Tax=Caldovatus aquaticus TaxID=2865671 RepID=A0ABS7F5T2_9PROT|nr:hypothetical protein [Caldovatus aquaticus]MBW8270673.1 hypothetical protein [Caldovatus aquaticus]
MLAAPVVWGEFADEAAVQAAMARLEADGMFRREEVLIRWPGEAAAEAPVGPPDEDPKGADARNQRQLYVGAAMAATGVLAAGAVVASGGAALPAAAAAAAAGATGAAGEAIGASLDPASTGNPPAGAEAEGPLLGLRARTAEGRQRAEAFLRARGARRIHVQETRAG